jgi:hypothetical protein
MNRPTALDWRLIFFLAALGLVRPLLSIAGVYDGVPGGRPWLPLLVTALVAAIWVGAVLVRRDPNPLLTLAGAGVLYGIFAILLQQIGWNLFLGGAPEGTPPSASGLVTSWVAILVTNTIWGAFLGLLATLLMRVLPRRNAEV